MGSDPEMWPDPAGMVKHLASKGVRVMVSAWPYTLKDGTRASSEITKPGAENASLFYKFPNDVTRPRTAFGTLKTTAVLS